MSTVTTQETVFVVDDDEAVRDSLRWLLEANGYRVSCYASAEAYLDAYLPIAHSGAISCLILDVRMSGMSGLELLPRPREARPDVPVIMITAYGDADTRRKAIEGGAAGLFTKPIDFPELRGEIGRRLDAATGAP